jgi:ribulose-5-phosphate 4-epimerase/fuculose-1-phosphate aldolase
MENCLTEISAVWAYSPYYVMKIGTQPLIPYYRPGEAVAHKHHAVLLANHDPVVAGSSLSAAGAAVEELEETARLHLLLNPSAFSRPSRSRNCARHFLP